MKAIQMQTHTPRNRLESSRPRTSTLAADIAHQRKEIRANWTPAQRRRRGQGQKTAADRRYEAHLRFVQFLLSRAQDMA